MTRMALCARFAIGRMNADYSSASNPRHLHNPRHPRSIETYEVNRDYHRICLHL